MPVDRNELMNMKHTCLVCGNLTLRICGYGMGSSGNKADLACSHCKSVGTLSNMEPWRGNELPLAELKALFVLAHLDILGEPKPMTNRYWGDLPAGAHPWWFVKTKYGWIEIGWRKRVVSIDWEDTPLRVIVTERDVTKGLDHVHAYSYIEVAECLSALAKHGASQTEQLKTKASENDG